jgi:hypothetical protein
MRFGLRAKSVENVNDVKSSLITARRIIFTPSVDLKDELADTAVQITCYDRNGEVVKRVTSTSGDVEDPENENGGENQGGGENQNQGGNGGTNQGGGDNGGGNGDNGGGGDNGGFDEG